LAVGLVLAAQAACSGQDGAADRGADAAVDDGAGGVCVATVAGHWLFDATLLPDGGTEAGSLLALRQDAMTVTGAFCYGAWICDDWNFHGSLDCAKLTLDQDAVHIDNEVRTNHVEALVAADGSSFDGTSVQTVNMGAFMRQFRVHGARTP
jgi:hypothetical protein